MLSMQEKTKKRIVQLLAESKYSECAVCGSLKSQAVYRYKSQQYIKDYTPETLEPVCSVCTKKFMEVKPLGKR